MAKAEPKCICPVCPSYDSCSGKNELGFCLNGKSKCIVKEKGCLCMPCPVQKAHNFDKVYYCIRGNFNEQKVKL